MIGIDGEKDSENSVLSARFDDDDDDIMTRKINFAGFFLIM